MLTTSFQLRLINTNRLLKILIVFLITLGVLGVGYGLFANSYGDWSHEELSYKKEDLSNKVFITSDKLIDDLARKEAAKLEEKEKKVVFVFSEQLTRFNRSNLFFWSNPCEIKFESQSFEIPKSAQIESWHKFLYDKFSSGTKVQCEENSTLSFSKLIIYFLTLFFLMAILPVFPKPESDQKKNLQGNLESLSAEAVLAENLTRSNNYATQAYSTARLQLVVGCLIALVGVVVFFFMADDGLQGVDTARVCYDDPSVSSFENSSLRGNCVSFDTAKIRLTSTLIRDMVFSEKHLEDNTPDNISSLTDKISERNSNLITQISTMQPSPKSLTDQISFHAILKGIGVLLAIESVAFFLLRDYRRSMLDLKNFDRQATINANKLAAYKLINEVSDKPDNELGKLFFTKILTEDMLVRLKDNETTENLELADINEQNPIFGFFTKVFDLISSKNDKKQ